MLMNIKLNTVNYIDNEFIIHKTMIVLIINSATRCQW